MSESSLSRLVWAGGWMSWLTKLVCSFIDFPSEDATLGSSTESLNPSRFEAMIEESPSALSIARPTFSSSTWVVNLLICLVFGPPDFLFYLKAALKPDLVTYSSCLDIVDTTLSSTGPSSGASWYFLKSIFWCKSFYSKFKAFWILFVFADSCLLISESLSSDGVGLGSPCCLFLPFWTGTSWTKSFMKSILLHPYSYVVTNSYKSLKLLWYCSKSKSLFINSLMF